MAEQRLRGILNIAESKEQDAALVYSGALREVEDNEGKLEELLGFRTDYHQQSMGCASASRLQSTRQFLSQLNEVIDLQEQQLEIKRGMMEVEKDNWLGFRVHRKSLEKLSDKRNLAFEKQQQKREEEELDELVSQFKSPI